MDDDAKTDLHAKLSTLEFVLECAYAQFLAGQDRHYQKATLAELRHLAKRADPPLGSSNEDIVDIIVTANCMTNRLLERIEARAERIRLTAS